MDNQQKLMRTAHHLMMHSQQIFIEYLFLSLKIAHNTAHPSKNYVQIAHHTQIELRICVST